MVKPIICFDLDGTIVDEKGRIHPDDIEILRTERRVTFIPATGRPRRAIRAVFERNGLFSKRPIPFPMILQNGAVLYKPNEELHTVNSFRAETQASLLEIAQNYAHIASKWFTPEQIYVQGLNDIASRMARQYDLDLQPFSQAPKAAKFIKATFMANSAEALQPLKAATSPLWVERYFSIPEILEINAPGVGKGQMLAVLKTELGWSDAPTFVAGDGENDLSLFEQAAIAFCPDSCPAAIKSQADEVIDVTEAGLLSPILKRILRDRI
jgi:HAD superfamily hydrolase (TIGR01484 family)